jgi:hypothetical protein
MQELEEEKEVGACKRWRMKRKWKDAEGGCEYVKGADTPLAIQGKRSVTG